MQLDDCLRHWERARQWVLRLFECDDWGAPLSAPAAARPFEIIETEPKPVYDMDDTYINIDALHVT